MTDARPARSRLSAIAFVLATLLLFGRTSACARIIAVGPHRAIKLPSEAAAIVHDGDVIAIDTGTYRDCAVWPAARLTIEAHGPNVVIAGKVCDERGLFIITGHGTTIRGITFSGARGRYHNAAGILGLGNDLTVANSRFIDNENGILLGGDARSRVRIVGSLFRGNGSCEGSCAHGVYAGAPIGELRVEYCDFLDTRTAHHVKSRAFSTIVTHNEIVDGESGTSSYLIDVPNGGNVLIEDNVLQKGRNSSNPAAAITIGVEGVLRPTERLIVRGNRLTSALPESTVFVRNSTLVPVVLTGNRLSGKIVPLEGRGSVDAGGDEAAR